MNLQRIGILGGTFDPVHEGHLNLARMAKSRAGLDLVLLLPMADPAHREAGAQTAHRLEMCRLALENEEGIRLSDAGLQSGVRYTVDTVRILKKQYPDALFSFIMGADKLVSLPYWQEAQALFSMCEFLCFPRAGISPEEALEKAMRAGARVQMLDVPQTPYSSTMIRARVARYEDAAGLPGKVQCYIAENGLYREDLLPRIRPMMNAHRFRHTLGVVKAAVKLADLHGLPVQKAALAALLHDIAKGMSQPELAQIAEHYGLVDPEKTLMIGAVLHGPVGAWLAGRDFGVTDGQVLDAIRNHTTGRAGMTPFEMAVFVADAIEENREDYPGLAQIRALSEKSLAAAVLCSIEGTIRYIRETDGRGMDPATLQTQAYLTGILTEEEKMWMQASMP